jgi:hypothetical protein
MTKKISRMSDELHACVSLCMGGGVRVTDALPGGGEDHEDNAGQEARPQRQVDQELPHFGPGVGEQAALYAGVGKRHRQEHDRREEGVDEVERGDPEPRQIVVPERGVPLGARAGEVERVEAPEGGHAVVQPAVAADEAVGEGEEHAGDGAGGDERHHQVPVGRVAHAVVAEGRRQRLERQHGARRQQLHEVRRRARQRRRRRLAHHHPPRA